MTENVRAVIQKLNGENYSTWSYKVQLLLMKEKNWEVIKDPAPTPVDASWTAKDEAAQATIGLLVEDSQLRLIRKATSAKEQWDTLKGYHQKATLSSKMALNRRFFRTVLPENGDMMDHVATLSEYVDKLAGFGQIIPDDVIVGVLLSSVPESYDTLIMALESRSDTDLTADFVKGKLIDEYMRRKDKKDAREENASSESAMKTTYKEKEGMEPKKVKCFFCKKPGHVKAECKKYKAWKEKHPEKASGKANKVTHESDNEYGCYLVNSEVCLKAKGTINENSWIIDSGATSHMLQKKDFFDDLDTSKIGHVCLADDKNRVKVEGVGSATIKCSNSSGAASIIKVCNVLYVPSLGANLLSVRKLVQEGYRFVFGKDGCTIINEKSGNEVATATLVSNFYELQTEKALVAQAALGKRCAENCHHVWHRRFGHRYTKAIKKLADEQLATGIKISDCGRQIICEDCIKGKLARIPFPKESKTQTHAPFDLVHTDVGGPMRKQTPGNKRYYLTIIDDYSRYTVLHLMAHKGEAASLIKQYVKMTKTQFNKVPKIIRSDRGREYVNNDLQDFCRNEGIRIQYTAPSSPQQNGVAERKNRSLLDMSRCMLFDADLDTKYWGEAIHTANYLQNRLPSKATSKTPYELWHSEKPDLSNLQIFGSAAYKKIPEEHRTKLDAKAIKLVFVGYSDESKAYRLLDTETDKIRISRDVTFLDKRGIKQDSPLHDECEVVLSQQEALDDHQDENGSIAPSSETESNHEESCSPDSDSSENESISEVHEDEDVPEAHEQAAVRRSERSNRGVPPDRYMAALKLAKEDSEPASAKEALSRPDKNNWKNAMDEEINSLKKNGTWQIVPRPDGRDIVTCKWVFKTKTNAEGQVERYKARLVARGFSQKYGTDYDEVFAPVVKQTTFRTLLTVAGNTGMHVKHFDAKTAFLNGKLKETIYMQQPDGYIQGGKEMVCKLEKGIYGLKQAAKVWYDHLSEYLAECGFVQSKADPCLFIKEDGGEKIYLIVYVDDFLIACKDMNKINEIAKLLALKFQLKDLGCLKYYLGIEIRRNKSGFFCMKQSNYINKIVNKFGLQDAKISNVPLDPAYIKNRDHNQPIMPESERYQQLIGALLYLAINTRPDIAASVTILSQHNKAPTTTDWHEAKRVARYLNGTKDVELTLGKKNGLSTLTGYADADWAENRLDRKSNSGYFFQYYGSPISWACRKQPCVSLSSTEAEFIALAEATQEGIWIRRLLEDFTGATQEKTMMYEDNQSCLKLLDNKKFNHRTKHIDTKYHFVKDIKCQQLMEYRYCPTAEMIADMLTKPLARIKLRIFSEMCGLTFN